MLSRNEFIKKITSNDAYLTAISSINAEPVYQMFLSDYGGMGEERFKTCHFAIEQSIYDGEIIKIDSSLDNLIYDTKPLEVDIKMPYDKFFINKYFEYDDFIVCGVSFVKTEYGTAMIVPVFDISEGSYGNFDCITGVIPNDTFNIGNLNIHDVENIGEDEDLQERANKKGKNFMTHIAIYVANTLNILTMHNPNIEYIKTNSSDKPRKTVFGEYNPQSRPITRLNIKGDLKQYVTQYNKIKKSKKFKKMIVVRGHWRTYSSDRYTKKKGKTEWIAPYFKGSGKEVMHKFVLVSE